MADQRVQTYRVNSEDMLHPADGREYDDVGPAEAAACWAEDMEIDDDRVCVVTAPDGTQTTWKVEPRVEVTYHATRRTRE